MNILFISTWDCVGGAALSAWKLGLFLRRRGHDVKFIVGNKLSADKHVYMYPRDRKLANLSAALKCDLTGLRTAVCANDIDFGIGDEIMCHPWFQRANVVHCQNLHGGYFKLTTLKSISLHKPTIWTLHDEWAVMPHGAWATSERSRSGFFERDTLSTYPPMLWDNSRYLKRKKQEIYNELSCTIVTPSRWLATIVQHSVLDTQSIRVIHNGVETSKFHPSDKTRSRTFLSLPLNKKIILLVANAGNRNSQKGWNMIDSIAARCSRHANDIQFICVGGGPRDTALSQGVVQYIPYIQDQAVLTKYYAAADALLFPSLHENFPLVILEAQACGLPVVSFDVGGVKEAVVHKKTGYIAKYMDIHDLVAGLEYIIGLSGHAYTLMALRATKNMRQNFSQEKMGASYERLYAKLIK